MHHPSSRSAQRQTRHFLPRYATIKIMCCLTFCLQRKSRCTPCVLECMTDFSRRQTTGCVELFSLACYILITRAYERILPCMYCITMYVTQNAVCNCEIKSILTYLLYSPVRKPFQGRRASNHTTTWWRCRVPFKPLVKQLLSNND